VLYITERRLNVLSGAWKDYLANVNNALPSSTNLPAHVSNILFLRRIKCTQDYPNLGIALSGGGYRATLVVASVLTSFDGRNTTKPVGTNGLAKRAAGFPVTIADSWGRVIARHCVNGTSKTNIISNWAHGAGVLFSGIKDL